MGVVCGMDDDQYRDDREIPADGALPETQREEL